MASLGFPMPDKIQEVLQPNQTAIDDDKTKFPDLAQLNQVRQLSGGRREQPAHERRTRRSSSTCASRTSTGASWATSRAASLIPLRELADAHEGAGARTGAARSSSSAARACAAPPRRRYSKAWASSGSTTSRTGWSSGTTGSCRWSDSVHRFIPVIITSAFIAARSAITAFRNRPASPPVADAVVEGERERQHAVHRGRAVHRDDLFAYASRRRRSRRSAARRRVRRSVPRSCRSWTA